MKPTWLLRMPSSFNRWTRGVAPGAREKRPATLGTCHREPIENKAERFWKITVGPAPSLRVGRPQSGAEGLTEPPRVSRRLYFLRGWESLWEDQLDIHEKFVNLP